jgi:hypothetical protein
LLATGEGHSMAQNIIIYLSIIVMKIELDFNNYIYAEYVLDNDIRYFIDLSKILTEQRFAIDYRLYNLENWLYVNNDLIIGGFYF